MYALNRHLHPPTGIEHCVYCNFFSSSEKNLVIAGVSQLHVYRLNPDTEGSGKKEDKPADTKSKKNKLECVASFSLFGNVMSMECVRLAGAPRDALLMSFAQAKLSLLEYDPGTHDLKTSSLHYFEEDELKDGHMQQHFNIPTVRVDPDGRCAAMLVYGAHLVVLPFRREGASEELDGVPGTRQPILSSYIIDMRKLDEKITNILDIQFLHGYYEPTLFILYEPLPTWAGRVAVRHDSCSIAAISLNIQQRVHPIIWSLDGLPYDCFRTYPVPKPIGGVLVFAVNSLVYLNQSVPPYGVSLNSITDTNTEFILKVQEGVKIQLDCAQASRVSNDKLVISLKGGELYVLTLVVDGMRCVRSFNFDKAAASVLTTCMCICEEGYLFLGSRLGNSLLLKYTEKAQESLDSALKEDDLYKKEGEPPAKKKKGGGAGDWVASDVSQLDDLDELEVYGSEAQAGTQITSYSFEVCDSIMNIGPCAKAEMGEPAFLSEEFGSSVDPDLELVTTSGYGKNGALCVLQRSIRPQVVTTFELPGCHDMWTVKGAPQKPEETQKEQKDGEESSSQPAPSKDRDLENSHALLILSREDSSMILETGQEIMELDHSGFSTQGPTVFAANIGENKYIVQVSPMGVRLLEGVNQLQHIPIDVGSPIVTASIADPYCLIMSEDGQVMLLHLRQDSHGSGVRLAVVRPQAQAVQTGAKIQTICAYRDVSGMFVTTSTSEDIGPATTETEDKTKVTSIDPNSSLDKSTVDDEDELLYGDSDLTVFPTKKEERTKPSESEAETIQEQVKPTYWALLARDNGVLEIFTLPDFKPSFLVKNFVMGHKVLVDSGQLLDPTAKPSASTTEKQQQSIEMPVVNELLLVALGSRRSRPHLMARVDNDLLIYEAFPYHQSPGTDNHLKLRFKKVRHGLILRERKATKKKKNEADEESETPVIMEWVRLLRPFDDIAGYSGVFICGLYPHWMFMTARGCLRIHPMGIDGTVTCFAPFHNVNCPKGFLYFNRQGELRISVLPTHLTYDNPWPVRKVPLRCTPHFVVYHPDTKTYTVVTSAPELCSRVVQLSNEGEKEFEVVDRDDRFIYPTINKFSLQLFSPISWEPIPNTKYDMEDFEHVVCLKTVYLKSEGTLSGMKPYIAVASMHCYGEEVTTRGRVLIYDVIEVVPEPGQPLTKNKFKAVYSKEQKGPVTTLCDVEGLLVTAIGQKIYIWTLKDNDLSGVAFIDTQIYIHSMVTVKNLILVADVSKSISLLRYQVDKKVLSLVSRDIKPLEVYAIDYLIDGTQVAMLVSDRAKNVVLFSYQPEARESHGGQRLLRKADINLGSHIHAFFRVRCKLTDPSTDKRLGGHIEKRHVTYFATLDGSLGYILPITEKMYRRLLMLQNALTTQIPHIAGLNPKAYRLLHYESRILANPQRSILDGDLLWHYLHLSITDRGELARKIGTTVEQILDDLIEVDRVTAHF